ncbi:hypothetical protein FB645_000278 [Coemansia sp. IMI 203386]|nr:hypothetical protein FB645_000278 [Coemansia sp. IMI 203386]
MTINNRNTLEDALPFSRPNKTSQYIDSRAGSKQYDEENGQGRRRVPANPMSSLLYRGSATTVSRESSSLSLDIRKLDQDLTSQVSGGTSMIAISTVMVFATFVAF